ncbi:MAG: hypothetical protein OET44_11195 [Gammaproteobacteria bacterium]|nr:hypothetical protein [Gammaproteobacteria bacterium]
MNGRLLPSIALMAAFAYGSFMVAASVWNQPEPFIFGVCSGLLLGLALHVLVRLKWKEQERAFQEYASYVANTVSLIYMRHAPCPACGHTPRDDYADGFGSHAATCPILAEITEFGKAPRD